MNYDYPDGSYDRRREIVREHEEYQKGLMYFIASDPRVPADVQTEFRTWGLARDEFVDNGHWPHQIYVREARRMVGAYVMTEHELLKRRPTPEPVGMGSYGIDSHNIQRYITPEGLRPERGRHRCVHERPVSDRVRLARSRSRTGRQSAGACLRLELAHRVRQHPHGAGVHDPRPVRGDRGGARDRRGRAACRTCPYTRLRERLLADGQVLAAPG